jgi:hypothetical protein
MASEFAFATGDGSPTPGVVPLELLPDSGVQSVFVFLKIGDGSSPPASACVTTATGDEICGFDVTIEVAGGHQIISFDSSTSAASVEHSPETFDATTTTIHAVGLLAIEPVIGAQLIGELQIDTQPIEGSVTVKGTAVRANLEPVAIEDEIVAVVPEADSILVLIAGILTLGILHSLRSRRDSFSPIRGGH